MSALPRGWYAASQDDWRVGNELDKDRRALLFERGLAVYGVKIGPPRDNVCVHWFGEPVDPNIEGVN